MWLYSFSHIFLLLFKGVNMKCPKCKNTMVKKQESKTEYYYECPKCHATIGKKK